MTSPPREGEPSASTSRADRRTKIGHPARRPQELDAGSRLEIPRNQASEQVFLSVLAVYQTLTCDLMGCVLTSL